MNLSKGRPTPTLRELGFLLAGIGSLLAPHEAIPASSGFRPGPSVKITAPADGTPIQRQLGCESDSKLLGVTGNLVGFRRSDFESGRYLLFVNGYRVPSSMISAPPFGTRLTFSVPSSALPYYPTGPRGSETREAVPPPARYPWSDDLSLGWDKRVRSILAEVVTEEDQHNLDSYIVRDLVSYIDPRKNNCNHHEFVWKAFELPAEGAFTLQLTPKHLKALEEVVRENVPPPTLTLAPDFPLTSTAADPRCTPLSDLSVAVWAAASSEILEVYRKAAAAGTRARNLHLCISNVDSTLVDIEFKRPDSLTLDPALDPLSASFNYERIESQSRTQVSFYIYGTFGMFRSSERTIGCTDRADTSLSFGAESILFTVQEEETYAKTTRELQARRVSTDLGTPESAFCGIRALDAHRTSLKREHRELVRRVYEGTLNSTFGATEGRNSFTRAIDAAIYPLSPAATIDDRNSGTEQSIFPIELIYRSGNPELCEERERGLGVSYGFLNQPTLYGSELGWGSWNGDDLLAIIGSRFSQSTCPVLRRDGSAPVFDPSQRWSATAQQSTSPLNQIVAARAGEKFRWSYNTVSDPEGGTLAAALEIPAHEERFVEIRSEFPPLVSPEWHYHLGRIRLSVIDRTSSGETTLMQAIATAFLDQSLLDTLQLGVGDPSAPDDHQMVLNPSSNLFSIQYTSIASAEYRPTSVALANSFDSFLKTKLTNYLARSLNLLPSPEYSATLPERSPRFDLLTWPGTSLSGDGAHFFPVEFSSRD